MTVGIPGTGIGGLFYVVAGLIAPLRRSKSKRAAAYVAVLAVGVLVGIFATGWLLGLLLAPIAKPPLIAGLPSFYRPGTENIVRWASLLGSVVLLGAVLLSVQFARLIQRKRWGK
jgi:MFS family permease